MDVTGGHFNNMNEPGAHAFRMNLNEISQRQKENTLYGLKIKGIHKSGE